MNKYKVTFKQQIIIAAQWVLTFAIILLISNYFADSIPYWGRIAILSFILLFDTFPFIGLHTQYYIKNKGAELIINKGDRLISYKSADKNISLSYDDISNVQYFVSFGRKTGVYSFAVYRYYKITFNDNIEFFITCLMMNDIEHVLESKLNFSSKKELRFLCFLPFGKKVSTSAN